MKQRNASSGVQTIGSPRTLNEVFTKRNLTVKPFNTGEEFFNNIVSFIDDETNNVNKVSDETRHKAFALFDDAWVKEASLRLTIQLQEGQAQSLDSHWTSISDAEREQSN